uniref:SCP domain-containing protein n=1 Tax=Schistosoma haematobium TaxID=6185 RepID=A0A094ZIH8_SCHHA
MNDTIRGQLLTMHNVVRQLAMYGLIPGQPKAVYMNPLLVWENTTDVGCGVTNCRNFKTKLVIVCNYGPG